MVLISAAVSKAHRAYDTVNTERAILTMGSKQNTVSTKQSVFPQLLQVIWTFLFFPNTSRTWSRCTLWWRAGSRSGALLSSQPTASACCYWVYISRWPFDWLCVLCETVINWRASLTAWKLLRDLVNCLSVSPASRMRQQNCRVCLGVDSTSSQELLLSPLF